MNNPIQRMPFNNPLHPSKADRMIEQFGLKPGSRVLDAGCGEGEFLVRIAQRYEIDGFGFDLDKREIDKAQQRATERVTSGTVRFAVQDAADFPGDSAPYDLIVCIGAEFIFGGYELALQKLKAVLAPGGLLLMGTIYWKQEPTAEYLEVMDGENPNFDHATTVALAMVQGFVPMYICRSSDDEWDDFEGLTSQNQYLAALNLPPGVERDNKIAKISRWQTYYLKWGMHTMGFGFYLLHQIEKDEAMLYAKSSSSMLS